MWERSVRVYEPCVCTNELHRYRCARACVYWLSVCVCVCERTCVLHVRAYACIVYCAALCFCFSSISHPQTQCQAPAGVSFSPGALLPWNGNVHERPTRRAHRIDWGEIPKRFMSKGGRWWAYKIQFLNIFAVFGLLRFRYKKLF